MILGLGWIGIILCAVPVCAEENTQQGPYNLDECVERALQMNPEIEQARLDVTEAEWKLQSAKLARTPSMELFNLMGVTKDAEGDAITGDTIDNHYGFFNRLNVEIAIPIYTFGRLSRGIDAAGENVNVQKASQIKTRDELIVRVHQLYYGLMLSRQVLDSMEDLFESFTEARDIAEERLEKSDPSVTEADVLKLKIGLAGVTEGVRKLERETELTQAALRQTLRLNEEDEFEIADERLKPVDFELRPLEQYLRQAENNNPDIQKIKAGLAAEEARYLSEKSKFYPSLLLVGGVRHATAPDREDQDNPFLNDDYNYFSAGGAFAVKWNMNLFQTNAEVQQKKVGYLRMKSRLQQGLDGITLKVKEKYYKVKEKQANLDTSFESRKSGRALMILTLTNFKFGIGTGKDVFDALGVYARTAGSYYEAVYDYNMAVAELKSVVGSIFQPQEPKEEPETDKK